ncbi:MAG: gliding motility lipoprotein GldH [Bacteroidetes bacterium]|nr:gliding motility lipoprotein GldH [Bacteroidota bacterium]
MARTLPLFVILLLLSACGENYLYEGEKEFDPAEWTYADSVSFEVEITDTTHLYDLILELEHATSYPRQNLYTKISTTFPDGSRLSKPVSLELADKAGVWYGDCNSDWCEAQIPIQTGAFFNEAGTYTFTFQQYTRINPLPGIRALEFSVLDAGPR